MFLKFPCALIPANTLLEVSPHRLNVNHIYWATLSLKLDILSLELREECNINNRATEQLLLKTLKALSYLFVLSSNQPSLTHGSI